MRLQRVPTILTETVAVVSICVVSVVNAELGIGNTYKLKTLYLSINIAPVFKML